MKEATRGRGSELKDTDYELFILVLSALSLLNWVFFLRAPDNDIRQVIMIVDLLLSLIFLGDFLNRLRTAESRSYYFLRQFGWLDLLSSLPSPLVKIARLVRMVRVSILLREKGQKRLIREFFADEAGSAVYLVTVLIVLMLEFGSIAVLSAEQDAPGADIVTAGDALWWSVVTISTVGYGDLAPVTPEGRLVGLLVILVGVALFGVITGFLANRFVRRNGATPEPEREVVGMLLEEVRALRAENAGYRAVLEERFEQLNRLLREEKRS